MIARKNKDGGVEKKTKTPIAMIIDQREEEEEEWENLSYEYIIH